MKSTQKGDISPRRVAGHGSTTKSKHIYTQVKSRGVTLKIHTLATRPVRVGRCFAASLSSLIVAECSSSNLVDNIEGKFCTVSMYPHPHPHPPPPPEVPSCEPVEDLVAPVRCEMPLQHISHEWRGTLS